jgi:hypothetical protein
LNNPEVVVVPSFFVTIGYVVWVWVNASQRKQRLKLMTEFHGKLIDRLGSFKDFSEFLHTPAGTRFMQDLASDPASVGSPQDRILRAAQFSAVLICLGIGLLLISVFWSPSAPARGQSVFATIGAIALSLGIGFAVSAVASYRLAGVLGLLRRSHEGANTPVTSLT